MKRTHGNDLRAGNRRRKTNIRKAALNFAYTRKTSKIIYVLKTFPMNMKQPPKENGWEQLYSRPDSRRLRDAHDQGPASKPGLPGPLGGLFLLEGTSRRLRSTLSPVPESALGQGDFTPSPTACPTHPCCESGCRILVGFRGLLSPPDLSKSHRCSPSTSQS